MKYIIFIALLLLNFNTSNVYADADNTEIVSGYYDMSLVIAYNKKSRKISGYYEDFSGWDNSTNRPRFECSFYLEGIYEGSDLIKIRSWYPQEDLNDEDIISGVLKLSDQKDKLYIKLDGEHGACSNVQNFTDGFVGFELEGHGRDWKDIRFVKSEKTYFYSKPSKQYKADSYVIRNDVLKVIKRKYDWSYIEYMNKYSGRIYRAWVKNDDLYDFE